jgi:uncharacterized membrane protein HdeD (DUF308 family)
MAQASTLTSYAALGKSRGWLLISGALFFMVGIAAMGSPLFFTFAVTRFLGIFALVSGIISLALAVFGKDVTHRLLEALSGVIRIVAGILILNCLPTSVSMITLIFALFLISEGVFFIGGAFRMRQHRGWTWSLLNGVAAVVLGVMVLNRWPSDSLKVLGLFFGINAVFTGVSFLMLGLGARSATPDAKPA